MQSRTFAVLLYGAVTLAPPAAAAQPSPVNPAASVPAVPYESGLAGYVPFREEKRGAWREANDEAGRVGGHIGIVREAAPSGGQPAATAPAPGTAKK